MRITSSKIMKDDKQPTAKASSAGKGTNSMMPSGHI
jgi:hypothetical protein